MLQLERDFGRKDSRPTFEQVAERRVHHTFYGSSFATNFNIDVVPSPGAV